LLDKRSAVRSCAAEDGKAEIANSQKNGTNKTGTEEAPEEECAKADGRATLSLGEKYNIQVDERTTVGMQKESPQTEANGKA
jgi:hypothetical protein